MNAQRPNIIPRQSQPHLFDIIGDVHGCCDELEMLLTQLGYEAMVPARLDPLWGSRCNAHPLRRKAVFLGDVVGRGPRILDTLRLTRNMVTAGNALCVIGNHEEKFMRALRGQTVQNPTGLAECLREIAAVSEDARDAFANAAAEFLDGLASHYFLDEGRLLATHMWIESETQASTAGEPHESCRPTRHRWAVEYEGSALVVHGHRSVREPRWTGRVINIDTGCVFGGKLTALRYPELTMVSVPAARAYCSPATFSGRA